MRVGSEIKVQIPRPQQGANGGFYISPVTNRKNKEETRTVDLNKLGLTDQKERSARSSQTEAEELKKIIEELMKKFDLFNKYLKIEIDEELDIPVVKIIEKETNRVIRQIPPEYLLKIMKNIDQMMGLLINERV